MQYEQIHIKNYVSISKGVYIKCLQKKPLQFLLMEWYCLALLLRVLLALKNELTMEDKINETMPRNQTKPYRIRNVDIWFLEIFENWYQSVFFPRSDLVLGSNSTHFWDFSIISWFPEILCLKSFGNSYGNLYTTFFDVGSTVWSRNLNFFENRGNNIHLIFFIRSSSSFCRWCTVLKILEVFTWFLVNSNCLLQQTETRENWFQNKSRKEIICSDNRGKN